VELAESIEWRLCKGTLSIHSRANKGAGDNEHGTQSWTEKILSLFARS
jgi:hypothetical protein